MSRCISMHSHLSISLRSTHRSRAGSHEDYFQTRLGFRDNFSRKSTRCHLSHELSSLFLFPHIQRHRFLGTVSISFYSYFSLFLSLSFFRSALLLLQFHDRRDERERERERRIERGLQANWYRLVLNEPRHEALFASNQSNEWIIFPNR